MDFPFLQKTSLWGGLSTLGKGIHLPKGIFYWSSRAKKEAEIDGTIGIAQDDDGTISHLKIAEEWAGQRVMERAKKANVFAYAPIEGVRSLREKWLGRILTQHPGLKQCATLPVVTNGITHALALASRLFLEADQSIITADKSWENYEHIFTDTQGVRLSTFPMFDENRRFNQKALLTTCRTVAIQQKKLVILFNFPHNQTGYMPPSSICTELGDCIRKLCREMPEIPFVILLDDAYESYVYDSDGQKYSILSQIFEKLPNLTVIKMDGISKVLLAYGYRVGFFTCFLNSLDRHTFLEDELNGISDEVGSKVGGLVRGEISQVNHHAQIMADALLDQFDKVKKEQQDVLDRLGDRWRSLIQAFEEGYNRYGRERIWADPCNGGFFCYLNLATGISPKEIAEKLLQEKKIGVVPSGQGLRVAFAGVPKEKISRMITGIFEVVYAR